MKKTLYILAFIIFTQLNAYNMDDYEFYTEACKRNDAISCSHLAIIYEQDILVKQDMDKAFKLYSKACGMNYPFACHNVAVYYNKRESPVYKKMAIKFYDRACSGGYTPSCIYLGRLYRDGRKVPQDFTKAKEKFAKACEGNNRLGCKEERILEELKESGYLK